MAEAWLALLFADLALRVAPIGRLQTGITSSDPRRVTSDSTTVWDAINRTHQMVTTAARHHLYPMLCLRQALALQWLLERRGIATTLRIGVSKGVEDLQAHAWLEFSGRPIGQPEEIAARFSPLRPPEATGAPQDNQRR